MKTTLFAGASVGLCMLASATAASAQSIDYGALEQLFNEPVTTSATGSPQRATQAPADMQIISAADIRRSGEVTLPGVLQRVAGIDVLNFSAGQADVNVRGYDQVSSPRLLVLVNGRQVYLDHYGLTVWASLPVQMDEIRQIEVVKGPNSALFGFNAVSGVVNIITFNPKFDDLNVATARVGDHGQRTVSLATTVKLGQAISARLSAGAEKQNEWARTGALPTAASLHDPRRLSTALDVVAQLAPKTELRAEGSWSNIQEDSVAGGYSYTAMKMITSSGKATLTSDTRLGQLQAQAYENRLTAKYGLAGGINWKNTIDVVSVQDLFKIGAANTIRLGGEYRHNTLNTAPITGGKVSYDVWSASAMWNWVVNDKLTTTAALRFDKLSLARTGPFPARIPLGDNKYWNRDINEPSLNLTAAWRPTDFDTFRLSYGRGVQAPSLTELGGVQLGSGPVYLLGNPNLRPTIVANYEAAYDRELKNAKLGVRFFLQDWTDLKSGISTAAMDFAPTATTAPGFTYRNVSDSKMKGVELIASGKVAGGFGWRANYTYTDVKDSLFPGFNAVQRYVAFAQTTPKSRGNLGVDWSGGPWEADANLHYVGDFQWYDITNGALQPVKAYASLSSRVGYKAGDGLVFAVGGQNLLNARQQQTRGLQAERRVQFTVSKSW
ncbi:TonB-dependent receptor [uncultured Caulobacter sp.]|uniref:TonB-dependent receptor plug domain-containing protein n=1 Tax=uncultured Caulobacter sp. TaxID=158749 RepID=UPI002617AACA|nr:TonB-dependent receptor [uncultured Caulobacter sp.]